MSGEVIDTVLRSLYVSGVATMLSLTWSVPASYILALRQRTGLVEALLETLVGMPTVLLGLLLYFLFSSSGPLAPLRLLYTPQAMIVGEAILVTPLIISTSHRLLRNAITTYSELALSLGAGRDQAMTLILRETSPGIIASAVMGFSRAVGELGIAMMVGGNISGYTRVATTAIALGVSRGEFEEALVLGLMLLAIMLVVAVALKSLSRVYVKW